MSVESARSRFSALLLGEAATVAVLVWLGAHPALAIDVAEPLAWLARTSPPDAVAAGAWVMALAAVTWLLATTLAAACATRPGATELSRLLARAAPPSVRRLAHRAAAGTLVAATFAPMSTPALAQPGPPALPLPAATAASPEASAWPVPGLGPGPPVLLRDPPTGNPSAAAQAPSPTTAPPPPSAPPAATASTLPGEHVVVPGDSLWRIAAARVAAARGTSARFVAPADIHGYWVAMVRANVDRLPSGDVDLLWPGDVVVLPPLDTA